MFENYVREKRIDKCAKETGWTREEIERGYAIFVTDEGTQEIQRIDELTEYGLGRFVNDEQAIEQAGKDGFLGK